ncbi:MAG: hypothetical protein JWQ69_874, partial [Pseudomonas sp.]|nr:hypothetical protein [Pseudomonas sp.]
MERTLSSELFYENTENVKAAWPLRAF